MARANRHYIPGYIWHITHRCHKKEFLLKFVKDRQRWIRWLFEAKKRFGLSVLNYSVTSNHIHLLILDTGKDVIPKSIQLIAGRTAQEYNLRKNRKGAFWEDRYHAVAVETEEHLIQCLVYIDLNMVRAGVVRHPLEWPDGGHTEILSPPKRYSIIDMKALVRKCGFQNIEQFQKDYQTWVNARIKAREPKRDPVWSESIAVGSKIFIENVKEKLGISKKGRKVVENNDTFILKEPDGSYRADFTPQINLLRHENMYLWKKDADILNS